MNNCVTSRSRLFPTYEFLTEKLGGGRRETAEGGKEINMGECYWKTESCVYNKTSTVCSQHLLGNLHALVCSHQIRRMLWYFFSGSAAVRTAYLHFLNLFPREQINTSRMIIQSLKGRYCHLRDKIVLVKRNFVGLKHSFSCSSFLKKKWAFCKWRFFTTVLTRGLLRWLGSSALSCSADSPCSWARWVRAASSGKGWARRWNYMLAVTTWGSCGKEDAAGKKT